MSGSQRRINFSYLHCMKIALKIICVLILFSSCKLASIEKRRYRHGFFVQNRAEKQEPREIQTASKNTTEHTFEIVRAINETEPQPELSNIVATTDTRSKVNVNNLLPIRTVFVKEHLRKRQQNMHRVKKIRKTNGTDTLIVELMLLILGLIWIAFSYGLYILVPALSLVTCLVIVGAILLAGLILLFIGYKNDQHEPPKKST
jgi:hypothetical protein